MSRKIFTVLLALLLVVILVSIIACGKKEEQQQGTGEQTGITEKTPGGTIKFGFIMPMSGPGSLWGESIKKDTDAFAAVINDEGGLKIGDKYYKVENYYANDEGLPENALLSATQLVNNNGVSAIGGYWGSGLASINTITAPAKVLTIFTTHNDYDPSTMPYTVMDTDNAYSIVTQLEAMLSAFPKTKKVGVSGNPIYFSIDFGEKSVHNQYKEMLAERNIGYFEDLYPWDATDFTQHLEKLKNEGVDLIHTTAAPQSIAGILKQMYQMGYKSNLGTTGTTPDLKTFIDMAGYDASQGAMTTMFYPWAYKEIKVAPQTLELALEIKDKHQELYNEEMNYDGGFSYGMNQMLIYFQAMQRAGTTDPDAVMKEIEGGTFDSFLGTRTFGGKQTYGRAVFTPRPGAMGKIVDYHLEYVADTPGDQIP